MRDKTPLVSVTICCYNSERNIAQTVQSVLDQTFTDFELIIVNDGSTDRTEAIVKGFDDPRIRYEYQQNCGLAATRNRTLELARGKYIAFLDHDDLWVPEKLALQIPILEARPDVAVCYANAATIDADGNITSERIPDFRAANGNIFADLLMGNFINWQTVIMRRDVLEHMGGFRQYEIVEDYDLMLRCAVEHTFVGVDHVLAKYRWHGSNFSRHFAKWLFELLELKEYWLAHLPDHYKKLRPAALQRNIAHLHYSIGMQLCLAGNIQAGREHLQQAWPESRRQYKLQIIMMYLLTALLDPRFYPRLVNLKRRLLTHGKQVS